MAKRKITIELDEIGYDLLQVLTCGAYAPQSVEEVVGQLIDPARLVRSSSQTLTDESARAELLATLDAEAEEDNEVENRL